MALYKTHFGAKQCNVEEYRAEKGVPTYFAVTSDTNTGAGREWDFVNMQFQDIERYSRVSNGYIIADQPADTLFIKLKFTKDPENEAWGDGIELLPGQRLPLYPYGLISAIRVENIVANPGVNLVFRIFAT